MITQERIEQAVQEAENKFWDIIAEHFPEITTGDFPPDESLRFTRACESAVETWVGLNEKSFNFENDTLSITDLEFEDQTDMVHGKYFFYFDSIDKNGSRAFDYDGYIILSPKNSRENDEVHWSSNSPSDWEKVEPYLISQLHEYLNSNK